MTKSSNNEIPSTPEDGLATPAPGFVGKLEEGETTLLNSLRQSAQKLVNDIGQLEAKKYRLLGSLDLVEARAQEIIIKAAERWEIPMSPRWSIAPDGSVYALDQPKSG